MSESGANVGSSPQVKSDRVDLAPSLLNLVAPRPANESERMRAVESLQILDTPNETIYDELTTLAAQICGTASAGLSVVDEDRVWFKARVGFDLEQCPRDISLCAHAILSPEGLVVHDTHSDDRFRTNELVTGPQKLRFYAGVPITLSNGQRVGALCVLDHRPYSLNEYQLRMLRILARQAVSHLETRERDRQREELQRLAESQRAQIHNSAKMAALGEMAAGIAHEINNPLAAMLCWAGELIERADDGETSLPRMREIGSSLERVGLRISRTVTALRNFARDGTTGPTEEYDLSALVAEVSELSMQRFRTDLTELRTSLPEEAIKLNCRPVEISQVMLNLLNNSLDSVSGQAHRWIELGGKVVEDDSGRWLEMWVRDSGPALSPDLVMRVMDPLFTTKPAGKGTGLGLSISQRIIQSHNGKLWVDESDEHARFVFRLPLPA